MLIIGAQVDSGYEDVLQNINGLSMLAGELAIVTSTGADFRVTSLSCSRMSYHRLSCPIMSYHVLPCPLTQFNADDEASGADSAVFDDDSDAFSSDEDEAQ